MASAGKKSRNCQNLPDHNMTKKTFLRKARVVQGKRWYIDFLTFDAATGEETRHRKDFDLNSIADLTIRGLVADRIAAALENFIVETGRAEAAKRDSGAKLSEAFTATVNSKIGSGQRKNSDKHFKAVRTLFPEWAKETGAWYSPIKDFSKKQAKQWRDWLKSRRDYAGRSINNYVAAMHTLWNLMKEDELTESNPFAQLKQEKESPKTRRIFSENEAKIVIERLRTESYFMFLAVLLIYYCKLRPVEICRLRRSSFFLDLGLVYLDASQAKMWKGRWATIPNSVLPFFLDLRFAGISKHSFWLGDKWEPNPKKALNPNTLFNNHRRIIDDLEKRGLIENGENLTLYSWKDTGITHHAKLTSPLATRDQAGHTDLRQTMQYYHASRVNEEYRDLPDTLGIQIG